MLFLASAVLLVGCGTPAKSPSTPELPVNDQPVACTMEAKICPDGSAVGRTGPNCEFADCPAVDLPPNNSTSTPPGWEIMEDDKQDVTFFYPKTIGATYVTTNDWPPQFTITKNKTYSCANSGSETTATGRTERVTVNAREYCVTRKAEGAAGSTYTQYAYAFKSGTDLATLAFTLRTVQCMNYDDPQKTECQREQTSFNPNQLADQISQTLKKNEK